MKNIALFLLLLTVTTTTPAQNRLGRYVSTHKAVLAADALGFLAMSADTASSVHCQNVGRERAEFIFPVRSNGCIETDSWLGEHPSAHAYWLSGIAVEAALTTFRHLGWHYAPSPGGRYVILALATIPTVIQYSWDTADNVDAANSLAKARAHVMR